jgi:hypothetical protein
MFLNLQNKTLSPVNIFTITVISHKSMCEQQHLYACTNQGRINLNDTAVYIYWIMSAILCLMILFGVSMETSGQAVQKFPLPI